MSSSIYATEEGINNWKSVIGQLFEFYHQKSNIQEVDVQALCEENRSLKMRLLQYERPTKEKETADKAVSCSRESETLTSLKSDNHTLRGNLRQCSGAADELRATCSQLAAERDRLVKSLAELRKTQEKEVLKNKDREVRRVQGVESRLLEAYQDIKKKDISLDELHMCLKNELREKRVIQQDYEGRIVEMENKQKNMDDEISKLQETLRQQWKLIDFLMEKNKL